MRKGNRRAPEKSAQNIQYTNSLFPLREYKAFGWLCKNDVQPRTQADIDLRRKFEAMADLQTWVIL